VIQKFWIEAEIPGVWDLVQILIKKSINFQYGVFFSLAKDFKKKIFI